MNVTPQNDSFVCVEFPLDARDGSPRVCNGSNERDQAAKNDAFSSKKLATYIRNIFTISYFTISFHLSVLFFYDAWARPLQARVRCFHSFLLASTLSPWYCRTEEFQRQTTGIRAHDAPRGSKRPVTSKRRYSRRVDANGLRPMAIPRALAIL